MLEAEDVGNVIDVEGELPSSPASGGAAGTFITEVADDTEVVLDLDEDEA